MKKVKWKVAKLNPCLLKTLKEEKGVHLCHGSKCLTISAFFFFKEKQLSCLLKKMTVIL